MIFPILLAILLVNSYAIAMKRPVSQLILPKNNMTTVVYEEVGKSCQEPAPNKNKNAGMFAALSTLETETNKLVDDATSYQNGHDLIYKRITENRDVAHDDKRALYEYMEKKLDLKFFPPKAPKPHWPLTKIRR